MNKSILIDGMFCKHCVRAVREALEKIDGVNIELIGIGEACVDTSACVTDEMLKKAVEGEGYTVHSIENT